MEMKTLSCENAEAQSAVSCAKTRPISPPSSDGGTFCHRSGTPQHLLSQIGNTGGLHRSSSCCARQNSISADNDRSHSPFNALDSFILEMESKMEQANLDAPQGYRNSIISRSDQSLVPKSVSLWKPPDPQSINLRHDQSNNHLDISDLDLNMSQVTIRPPPITKNPRPEYMESCVSVYSSSIYSDQSDESEAANEIRAGSSSPETQYRSLDAEEISQDGTLEEHTVLLEHRASNAKHALPNTTPLRPFRSTSDLLTRDSHPLQTKTFLLDHSPSESKSPSLSSVHQSGSSNGIVKEGRSVTGSEIFSLDSSESNSESKRVRPCAVLHCLILNTSAAGCSPCRE